MNLNDIKKEIIEKHPQFKESKFRENINGWSNYVVVVDDEYIFRITRDEYSAKMLEIEKMILPFFRGKFEIEIPNFEYVSDKKSIYNYVGYKLIKGKELSKEILESLSNEEYKTIAKSVADFLSSLHSIDIISSRIDMENISNRNNEWVRFKDNVLEKSNKVLDKKEKSWISNIFDEFNRELSKEDLKTSFLHGDFTDDHILVNNKNNVSGIIDFGDLCIGDTAFDFAGIYSSYGKEFMELVISNYKCDVDANFRKRIEQFYIKQIPLHELLCGVESSNKGQIENAIKRIRETMKSDN
ncbi:MAG: aminoglycoside phosphotransferase family protein [Acidaminobacteraceae bacterium]